MSSPMIRLAERVGRRPAFLGCHLAALRREHTLTFAQQAAAFRQLGMPVMHIYVARQRVRMRLRQEVERLQRLLDRREGM